MTAISHQTLLDTLDYDPLTGEFRWKIATSRRVKVGAVAGSRSTHGYITIRLLGKLYYAHTLAWFYISGAWPTGLIDHQDTNRSNNRILNLRLSNHSTNAQNSNPHTDSLSGYKGVRPYRKRFAARIRVSGVNTHLGTFDSPEAAAEAYDAAAIKHFGQFAKTNRAMGLLK